MIKGFRGAKKSTERSDAAPSLIVKCRAAKLTLEYRFVSDKDLFKTPRREKEERRSLRV